VQLQQVETLDAQAPQREFRLLPQVFGPPERHPLATARARGVTHQRFRLS
jgi:hypothetical protein